MSERLTVSTPVWRSVAKLTHTAAGGEGRERWHAETGGDAMSCKTGWRKKNKQKKLKEKINQKERIQKVTPPESKRTDKQTDSRDMERGRWRARRILCEQELQLRVTRCYIRRMGVNEVMLQVYFPKVACRGRCTLKETRSARWWSGGMGKLVPA